MKYKTILFDLDGTLSDSFEGITKGLQAALKHVGIEAAQKQLRKNIGPPINESFVDMWGVPADRVDEAIAKYREYYAAKGIFENEMYEGVPEMLEDLQKSGVRLVTASAKPVAFVNRVLDYFGITKHFSLIVGSEFDGTRCEKIDIINYILEQLNIEDKRTVVMVGDRKYDLIGAEQAGIDCVGVLYGYAGQNELESYPSVFLAKTVSELHEFLRKS